MTTEAGTRFRVQPSSIDYWPIVKPEVVQLKQYRSVAMRFEMQIPEDWQEISARPGYTRLAQDLAPNFTDSQVEIHHASNYFMSAESLIRYNKSNPIETPSQPTRISVDGRTAWLVDVRNNPDVLSDIRKEPDATRTECVLNDADGSVWTIIFSTPSALIHRKQTPMFKQMLSSFRLSN